MATISTRPDGVDTDGAAMSKTGRLAGLSSSRKESMKRSKVETAGEDVRPKASLIDSAWLEHGTSSQIPRDSVALQKVMRIAREDA